MNLCSLGMEWLGTGCRGASEIRLTSSLSLSLHGRKHQNCRINPPNSHQSRGSVSWKPLPKQGWYWLNKPVSLSWELDLVNMWKKLFIMEKLLIIEDKSEKIHRKNQEAYFPPLFSKYIILHVCFTYGSLKLRFGHFQEPVLVGLSFIWSIFFPSKY